MAHKIKPNSFRIGILKNWSSRWFSDSREKRAQFLEEDVIIRRIITDKISAAGIAYIDIERTANAYRVFIKAARPGLIIGKGGKGIEDITKAIVKEMTKMRRRDDIKEPIPSINLNVSELARNEVSAKVTAQSIAFDLEKRFKFRRVIKKYIEEVSAMRGVKGVRIKVGGRLDGAEISRSESLSAGSLPLTTIRADIDYGEATARTTYGAIGIKVWIYKGEVFNKKENNTEK